MAYNCPVCGQALPKGMDDEQLHRRLEKLNASAAKQEAVKVRREEAQRYAQQLARSLKASETASTKKIERAVQMATEGIKATLKAERAQRALDDRRTKKTLDEMTQRVQHLTSEEMGEISEQQLLALLKDAYPQDDINRSKRGQPGLDIVQNVKVDSKAVGRIVYECKSGKTWSKTFVSKAKRAQVDYETPWVIIAARTLPNGQKGFTVEKTIPVVDLRFTVKLAEIVRNAVIMIGRMQALNGGHQVTAAAELLQYIRSDQFVCRFKGVTDAVTGLRDLQTKEKKAHHNTWTKQDKLHEEIDETQREIDARITVITTTQAKHNGASTATRPEGSQYAA